jgi:hypothetical protein
MQPGIDPVPLCTRSKRLGAASQDLVLAHLNEKRQAEDRRGVSSSVCGSPRRYAFG